MVRISNGQALATTKAIVPTIQKVDLWKSGCFCPDFKWLLKKWRPFVRLQMVRLLDYLYYLISGPFETQPLFEHSKSRLVTSRISNPLCSELVRQTESGGPNKQSLFKFRPLGQSYGHKNLVLRFLFIRSSRFGLMYPTRL